MRLRWAIAALVCLGAAIWMLVILQRNVVLFEEARQILGTKGLKATVRRAFEEVVALQARREAIRQLETMDGLDLDKPDVMEKAWRRP